MTLEEEGEILKAALYQAAAEYIAATEAYDKYLDRSIESINQAQRAIRELL